MAPPDTPEDDDSFASHPHPDDRLWRHPSEMGGSAGGPAASDPSTPTTSGSISGSGATVSHRRSGRSVLLPLALIALVVGSGLTLVGLSVFGAFDPDPARIVIEKVETDPAETGSIETVVDRIRPSIVRIEVVRGEAITHATGVIYRSDGYVITTADAVEGADSISVLLSDTRRVPARLVGIEPADDVAVLAIDGISITPVVLGDPDTLEPGEAAIALSVDGDIRNPTAIMETIAGSGRRLDAIDGSTLHDMIQAKGEVAAFDDAVLCAPNGAVLGIFTTRRPETGGAGGGAAGDPMTRFATPIDYAVEIADEIVATGSSQQPWLGVTTEDLDSITANRLGRSGTVLTAIADDGPARDSGLRVGDVIVTIDDAPITSATSLVTTLRNREVGASVAVTYIRDGIQRTTTVTLTDRP